MQKLVINEFKNIFGEEPSGLFFAPGRVNLIGEHTDYNDGFVFPCALAFGTYVATRIRDDDVVRVCAGDFDNEMNEWHLDADVLVDPDCLWSNYLRGVCAAILSRGLGLKGMDVYIAGNVPRGAGLSSSASLSVAFGKALSDVNLLHLEVTDLARIAQLAENDFAGCSCGIMDQLASAAGHEGHALLLDCKDLTYQLVSIPQDLDILIIDSRVERNLVGSEYNDRRADCERAAKALGVKTLREASLTTLVESADSMDQLAFKRARHILTENDRTLSCSKALLNNEMAEVERTMHESHVSMRDDFEITVPEIDFIVETVEKSLDGDGGVRMTGGGFGGCVVALVPKTKSSAIENEVKLNYLRRFDKEPNIYHCKAEQGARALLPTRSVKSIDH